MPTGTPSTRWMKKQRSSVTTHRLTSLDQAWRDNASAL
jgi:hypothetical protein